MTAEQGRFDNGLTADPPTSLAGVSVGVEAGVAEYAPDVGGNLDPILMRRLIKQVESTIKDRIPKRQIAAYKERRAAMARILAERGIPVSLGSKDPVVDQTRRAIIQDIIFPRSPLALSLDEQAALSDAERGGMEAESELWVSTLSEVYPSQFSERPSGVHDRAWEYYEKIRAQVELDAPKPKLA